MSSLVLGPDYYFDEYESEGEKLCALLVIDDIVATDGTSFNLSSALLRKQVLVLN
jgi:hypothetical protein